MNDIIQIAIKKGNLKPDELAKLLQCVREIEQKDPTRHLDIWINAPSMTVNELNGALDSITPSLRYRAVLKDGLSG